MGNASMPATTDLCDKHGDRVQVAEPVFRSFGGNPSFGGRVTTVQVFEDNVLVAEALERPGQGAVLVVDGAGSLRCALLGDRLGARAVANGWSGVVVHGCVRDADALARLPLGVRALNVHPRRSAKNGTGSRDVPVRFAGLRIDPGAYLYADTDGIVLSDVPLVP